MSQLFASGGQSIGVLSNVFKKNIYLAACGLGWGLRDLALWHPDFLAVVRGLRCSVARGILVPPPGMESVSPALQGRFLTIGPPQGHLYISHLDVFFLHGRPVQNHFSVYLVTLFLVREFFKVYYLIFR